MIYTTKERNDTILLIAAGKEDLKDVALYERLQEFKWITINKINGIVNNVELTSLGKDLNTQLLKQQAKENHSKPV